MSGAALAIKGLACARGGRLLFTGLNLELAAGQSALIAGPNGIGKSSLLRLVAGLLTPFAGTIAHRGNLALADEAAALDRDRTLRAALSFWARLDGAPAQALDAALADLHIAHLADIPVRMLSTGQRKRAALARTIASGAAIWLLDEPANGLDAASAQALAQVVTRHRAAGGIVLAASHTPLGWPHDLEFTLSPPDDPDIEPWEAEP
jgi:heme exporter protein A